jgi:signal transduction histidine kinase
VRTRLGAVYALFVGAVATRARGGARRASHDERLEAELRLLPRAPDLPGLPDALKAMARAAPVPVRVLAQGIPRFAADGEAAVYFTCADALQNAAKHGGRGATARILLRHETEGLAFEVRDDGRGLDPARCAGTASRTWRTGSAPWAGA